MRSSAGMHYLHGPNDCALYSDIALIILQSGRNFHHMHSEVRAISDAPSQLGAGVQGTVAPG